MKKIDVKNHISAQAAYEYCRNKTLWNSAKDRAYKAMPDSSFDTEIIQNKIRASIQETYGANELNSSSIFQGKWAIPDPQPNAEASDIIQKNWFSNEINIIEAKHWGVENASKLMKEFTEPTGKYYGQDAVLNSDQANYFRNHQSGVKITEVNISSEDASRMMHQLKDNDLANSQMTQAFSNATSGGVAGGVVAGIISITFNSYKLKKRANF